MLGEELGKKNKRTTTTTKVLSHYVSTEKEKLYHIETLEVEKIARYSGHLDPGHNHLSAGVSHVHNAPILPQAPNLYRMLSDLVTVEIRSIFNIVSAFPDAISQISPISFLPSFSIIGF